MSTPDYQKPTAVDLTGKDKTPKQTADYLVKLARPKKKLERVEEEGDRHLADLSDPARDNWEFDFAKHDKFFENFDPKNLDKLKDEKWGDFDVEKLIDFLCYVAEKVSNKKLRPYQIIIQRRIFRSLLINDGELISVLISRQAGKSLVLATTAAALLLAMPVLGKAYPEQLGYYADGFYIGVYAPTDHQSEIIYNRVIEYTQSSAAYDFYEELDVKPGRKKGTFSNGSFIFSQSASKRSNIEGFTTSLLLMDECVTGDTLVSMADGSYKRIDELAIGDNVISWDGTKSEPQKVTAVFDRGEKVYDEITFSHGEKLRVTDNHPVFVINKGWTFVSDLSIGDKVLLDGNFTRQGTTGSPRNFDERVGEIEAIKRQVGKERVYDITVANNHNFFGNGVLIHNCQDMEESVIAKSIEPTGAETNATQVAIGTPDENPCWFYDQILVNRFRDLHVDDVYKNHYEFDYNEVIKHNPRYEKFVEKQIRRYGIESRYFQMKFGLRWFFEEGQPVSEKEFKRFLTYIPVGLTLSTGAPTVVGIDIATSPASTVVTVGKLVDLALEYDDDKDLVKGVQVCDWLELTGMPYSQQRPLIKSFLEPYGNIHCISLDATNNKTFFEEAEKEWKNVARVITPVIFTSKLKGELASLFFEYFYSRRILVPSTDDVRKMKKYQNFYLQMINLKKEVVQGGNVVLQKNTREGSRDDYPDSLFLMLYSAKQAITAYAPADSHSDQHLFRSSKIPKPTGLEEMRQAYREGRGPNMSMRQRRANKMIYGKV